MKWNKEKVMEVLPHRDAMLMVDGIEEWEQGRKVVGWRDVADDEFWRSGHFPGRPLLPGVLIIEMMAQVCAFLFVKADKEDKADKEGVPARSGIPYIAKVDEVKFMDKVYPGSRLVVEALFDAEGAGFVRANCKALCDGRAVAKGRLTCCLSLEEGAK
jgi:3-hydroxyacyl-[acyl-carrier-protein] dehydratase